MQLCAYLEPKKNLINNKSVVLQLIKPIRNKQKENNYQLPNYHTHTTKQPQTRLFRSKTIQFLNFKLY